MTNNKSKLNAEEKDILEKHKMVEMVKGEIDDSGDFLIPEDLDSEKPSEKIEADEELIKTLFGFQENEITEKFKEGKDIFYKGWVF